MASEGLVRALLGAIRVDAELPGPACELNESVHALLELLGLLLLGERGVKLGSDLSQLVRQLLAGQNGLERRVQPLPRLLDSLLDGVYCWDRHDSTLLLNLIIVDEAVFSPLGALP